MLLTIYNLPAQTRYVDVKSLIHTKCGFTDVILDNLMSESNNTKKVTVGLAEEEDAAILMRKINGLYVEGQQLYVTTMKKKAPSAVMDLGPNTQQPMLQQPYYQQSNQPNYEQGYKELQPSRTQAMLAPSMAYSGMYGGSQNSSANYGYPQQMQLYQSTPQQLMAQSMLGYDQGAPLGFSNQGSNPSVWSDQNDWNLAGNASAGNQVTQQGKNSSRWENNGDSSSRSRRDALARDSERDRPARFGRDTGPRDAGRSATRRDFGRDAPSRDRGRDAPRDLGRDRDQGRDRNHGRDRNQGRDRDQGRDRGQGRDRREAQARDRGRDAPPREHGRDALYNRRPEPFRAPTKRQLSPPRTYGAHAANSVPAPQMRTFSQQRDGPKPNQSWGKPQPKQKKPDSNYTTPGPPAKRPKNQASVAQQSDKPQTNVPANTTQAQPSLKKKKVFDTPEKRKERSSTWRYQIAAQIAKEIMSNPKNSLDNLPFQFLQDLKRAIRSRLEELFGDNFEITMPEMLQTYKEKFDPINDTAFFNKVLEDAKTNVVKAIVVAKKEAKKENASTVETVAAPVAVPASTTNTIPSYPQGDKRANKEMKKNNAVLLEDEGNLLLKMDENMRKAVIEEIDALATEVASEYDGIESEITAENKRFFERKKPHVLKEFKKMMTLNMAKRILNIGPIMLRIFTEPKMISRGKLAPILAKYGITSLRKSEKKKAPLYFGTCDSYQVHDKLIKMKPITIEDSTVVIKPFQLTGKFDKKKKHGQSQDQLELEEDESDEDGTNDYEEQDEYENAETNDPEDFNETVLADDEDTNGNIKMDPNDDNAETAQENGAVKSENGENTEDKPDEAAEPSETKADKDLDFTADVDISTGNANHGKGTFKIDVPTDLRAEKNLSEVKAEDLVELKGNIIDDIDMADLDDDDLEDW